jgi:hypothetical protein
MCQWRNDCEALVAFSFFSYLFSHLLGICIGIPKLNGILLFCFYIKFCFYFFDFNFWFSVPFKIDLVFQLYSSTLGWLRIEFHYFFVGDHILMTSATGFEWLTWININLFWSRFWFNASIIYLLEVGRRYYFWQGDPILMI